MDEDNLILTNDCMIIANVDQNNIGDSAKVIQELGNRDKADVKKLEEKLSAEAFSFDLSSKPSEANALFKLIIENPNRLQLIKDINKHRVENSDDTESLYVSQLYKPKDSENETYYKLIFHFEMFQRKLHVLFNHFLLDPVPRQLAKLNSAEVYLQTNATEIKLHGEKFRELAYSLSASELNEFKRFIDIIDNILPRLERFEELSHYLIKELHGKHQVAKNKAPWVHLEGDLVTANRANIKGEQDLKESRVHRFRYANANNILIDLGKLSFK